MAGVEHAQQDLARVKAPESLRRFRVTEAQAAKWPPGLVEIRTCLHCKAVYQSAGHAWRCEHWHEYL